jgi:hypothetical protein
MSDYNILAFKHINNFVNELSELFGQTNHPLKLYKRLLDKTTINHTIAINKHVDAFKLFCVENRDLILKKNVSTLKVNSVVYSDKVYIDFSSIFRSADKETINIILKHLLTISAFLDPTGKAKEILKNSVKGKEADFLNDILTKVENNITPDMASNPMSAVSTILSSGIFNDLLSNMNNGVKDGSLDLGKLMGTVQNLVSTLSPSSESKSDGSGGMGGLDIAGIISSLGSINGDEEGGGCGGLSGITNILKNINLAPPPSGIINTSSEVSEVSEVSEISEAL